MPGYQSRCRWCRTRWKARFARAIEGFDFWRASKTLDAFEVAQVRYQFVLIAVSAGGVIAALLVFATYVFLRRRVLQPLQEAGHHFDRIAGGDLTARIEARNTNEIGLLFAALKRMQESLTRTVSAVRRGVDEINVGSHEIAAGNTDLSSRTEQQAASLERPRPRWSSWPRPSSRTRTTRARPISWRPARVGRGRARRFGGVGSGDDDARHLGQLAQDFRDRVGDRRHRVPDQHPGAERGGGSGAGGRAGQGFRGGGGRGALAGAAQQAAKEIRA